MSGVTSSVTGGAAFAGVTAGTAVNNASAIANAGANSTAAAFQQQVFETQGQINQVQQEIEEVQNQMSGSAGSSGLGGYSLGLGDGSGALDSSEGTGGQSEVPGGSLAVQQPTYRIGTVMQPASQSEVSNLSQQASLMQSEISQLQQEGAPANEITGLQNALAGIESEINSLSSATQGSGSGAYTLPTSTQSPVISDAGGNTAAMAGQVGQQVNTLLSSDLGSGYTTIDTNGRANASAVNSAEYFASELAQENPNDNIEVTDTNGQISVSAVNANGQVDGSILVAQEQNGQAVINTSNNGTNTAINNTAWATMLAANGAASTGTQSAAYQTPTTGSGGTGTAPTTGTGGGTTSGGTTSGSTTGGGTSTAAPAGIGGFVGANGAAPTPDTSGGNSPSDYDLTIDAGTGNAAATSAANQSISSALATLFGSSNPTVSNLNASQANPSVYNAVDAAINNALDSGQGATLSIDNGTISVNGQPIVQMSVANNTVTVLNTPSNGNTVFNQEASGLHGNDAQTRGTLDNMLGDELTKINGGPISGSNYFFMDPQGGNTSASYQDVKNALETTYNNDIKNHVDNDLKVTDEGNGNYAITLGNTLIATDEGGKVYVNQAAESSQ